MVKFTKHKQRLLVLAEGVNSFSYESVQLRVITWLLDHPEILFKESEAVVEIQKLNINKSREVPVPKPDLIKPLQKKSIAVILKELLCTDFLSFQKRSSRSLIFVMITMRAYSILTMFPQVS